MSLIFTLRSQHEGHGIIVVRRDGPSWH